MESLKRVSTDIYYPAKIGKIVNDMTNPEYTTLTVFDTLNDVKISLTDYLTRWNRYSDSGIIPMLMAVIYMIRFSNKTGVIITNTNVHRLSLAALVIATKFLHDDIYTNRNYGDIGGVPTKELNILERHFLVGIDWDLLVSEEEISVYL